MGGAPIWNGKGNITLAEIVQTLDSENLAVVGDLLKAMATGPTAVDEWIGSMLEN